MTTESIAFVCIKNAEPDDDPDAANVDEEPPLPLEERLFKMIFVGGNCMSAILLALTAAIYGLLRTMQDTHEICTFHLTYLLCALHTFVFYQLIMEHNILPNFCLTRMYLEVYLFLSVFSWSAIIGYNCWIQARSRHQRLKEDTLMTRYRYFGYGLPAALVVLCNIYAHGAKLYSDFRFELACYKHQELGRTIFVEIPYLLLIVSSCYFWFDTQRLLWRNWTLDGSYMKNLRYRIIMNGRLCFTLGMPWGLLCLIYTVISRIFGHPRFLLIILRILFLVASIEGLWIFLILVVFRKRVLRTILREWCPGSRLIPDSWRAFANQNCGVGEETDCEVDIAPTANFERNTANGGPKVNLNVEIV